MKTEILAILAVAALFVLYGFLRRGRGGGCGRGCACSLLGSGCERREAPETRAETEVEETRGAGR